MRCSDMFDLILALSCIQLHSKASAEYLETQAVFEVIGSDSGSFRTLVLTL